VRGLRASPSSPRVICAPGNAGIMADGVDCFLVEADDIEGLVALAQGERVEFVVVGPEVPLALGLADELRAVGIPTYGPGAAGARLEASKIFTKELLVKYRIPTAAAAIFEEEFSAIEYLESHPAPIVIKADGLAGGKGVIVAETDVEAEDAVYEMFAGRFGESSSKILIEDCLVGEETSILVVVSGRDYVILPTSQDHKRIGEDDTGPNTGGMGTYSPAEIVTPEIAARIEREIVRPSVNAIADEGIDFRGTLFIGLMLTPEGPSVIEYNTRFGDPEAQVVLPRIENDLCDLLWRAALGEGALAGYALRVRPDYALCVVMAAAGYPGPPCKGDTITFPPANELPEGVTIYHAGTTYDSGGYIVTDGGRVLGVTAMAPSLGAAADAAYDACEQIHFAGCYYRGDIGARQLAREAAQSA